LKKALHGYKSPLYQQITRQSFQTVANDLFGSIYQNRPKKYIQAAQDFIKRNRDRCFFAHKEHYEDLVFHMEDMLAG